MFDPERVVSELLSKEELRDSELDYDQLYDLASDTARDILEGADSLFRDYGNPVESQGNSGLLDTHIALYRALSITVEHLEKAGMSKTDFLDFPSWDVVITWQDTQVVMIEQLRSWIRDLMTQYVVGEIHPPEAA